MSYKYIWINYVKINVGVTNTYIYYHIDCVLIRQLQYLGGVHGCMSIYNDLNHKKKQWRVACPCHNPEPFFCFLFLTNFIYFVLILQVQIIHWYQSLVNHLTIQRLFLTIQRRSDEFITIGAWKPFICFRLFTLSYYSSLLY